MASEDEQRKIELGPLFTAGAVLGVYGLLRRRWLAVAAGVGAMWLDQRSELGLALRERFRPLLIQVVPDDGGRPIGRNRPPSDPASPARRAAGAE